ncbi:Heme oxygenase [Paracoccus laeviglucosivorans]|uniref:Heme oxygenase n=2 Tax=Paracoccus laeviglucosivorans TaxID=1197861 RepID=A0A521BC85_9RHOB|nr:Heme oxygenase [Paracoccus laeviglucosivorans]
MGEMRGSEDYRHYLRGTYAFRAALEPALDDAGWQVERLLDNLRADLADLGEPVPTAAPAPALHDFAAKAAALYVLEGSALGARLIARRAAALGFDERHGARHLAQQTAAPTRWPAFLDWLEQSAAPPEPATAAARQVFQTALLAYGVEAGV